jgi:phosphatidylglycerol---prolipoprotein diacylglyceryl transferase
MYQIVFRIPFLNLPIYGYGLMLVIAFLVGVQVAKAMAARAGMDPEVFVNATLIALLTGVAGSRLSHVLENWSVYTNPQRGFVGNFLDAINIRAGGLTFYGGFILATPCCIAYALHKRLPLLRFIDVAAVIVMIGLGFGRIGCYLNGCCYGELLPNGAASFGLVTQFPYYSNAYIDQFNRGLIRPPDELIDRRPDGLALLKDWDQVRAEGLTTLANQQRALAVQPTQLYSMFTAFLLALLLWAYWTTEHLDGRVFALMLMLEGPARFILELIRVEPPVWGNFSLSMILGLALGGAGVVFWLVLGLKKSSDPRGNFVPAH